MTEYVRHNIIDTNGLQRTVTVPISMSETLTLRDQFAMAALPGIIINDTNIPEDASRYAYEMADAMLAAREKKND